MKILILGGTGVLSSSITQKCIEEGHEVVHFNRKKTSNNFSVETISGDRHNKEDLRRTLAIKPDVVIDMLCFGKEDAENAIDVYKHNVEQYIYCSTSCVYTPKDKEEVLTEKSDTNPISEYGKSKLAAEVEFEKANKERYFETTIFRPGHVFNKNFIVNNLTLNGLYVLERMKRNLDVILTEQGEKQWQACHADNIGIAFSKACGNKCCYNQKYNISGVEVFTWNDVYKLMINELNSKSKIIYLDKDYVIEKAEEQVDFLNTVTKYNWHHDGSLLKEHIGTYYEKSFLEGIREVISNNMNKDNYDYIENQMYDTLLNV
ncbi:NAD-dependent epimerase/dehydratase family protein [uncultured Clostridium sp.]|uniref:NAD-dependent epimerase/dehydratase family protein n=1 Tax=uncultured Clostridium sp. TaxID=59620 RepID=UPI0025E0A13D|nr:NAD-dependent epimerase/dehydratase family protein [uncultured Clostridium sp.]